MGGFEKFAGSIEGRVVNAEILKINKQIDDVIKQVE